MDATTANLEAAKKRLASLKSERDSITRRRERDAANLAALDAQITALEPLATEAQPAN